jgi:hypothetical protein
MPKPIKSLSGFVAKISRIQNKSLGVQFLFRGHSKTSYELKPSVFRANNLVANEHLMLRQLLAENPKQFSDDVSFFDRLVRCQHYGLPTRLLDVSRNPLVALYFSCCSNPASKGRVIIIRPDIEKQKYFDSDVVSMLSALSMLKGVEKTDLLEDASRSANSNKAKRVSDFNKTNSADRLIQMVRREKPFFRTEIDPYDLAKIASVTPRKLHERIKSQDGAFLLFGLLGEINETRLDGITIENVDIKSESKERILSELSVMGISEKNLFPEIEKSASQIKKRYS